MKPCHLNVATPKKKQPSATKNHTAVPYSRPVVSASKPPARTDTSSSQGSKKKTRSGRHKPLTPTMRQPRPSPGAKQTVQSPLGYRPPLPGGEGGREETGWKPILPDRDSIGCQLGRVVWLDTWLAGGFGVGWGYFQGLGKWGLAWGLPLIGGLAALVVGFGIHLPAALSG